MTDSDIPNIMQPYSIELDLETGEMLNPARTLARHASDMRGHYADAAALDALIADGDPLHYEVFDVPVPEEYGQLMYGISTLQPGLERADAIHQLAVFLGHGHVEDFVVQRIAVRDQGVEGSGVSVVAPHVRGMACQGSRGVQHLPGFEIKLDGVRLHDVRYVTVGHGDPHPEPAEADAPAGRGSTITRGTIRCKSAPIGGCRGLRSAAKQPRRQLG